MHRKAAPSTVVHSGSVDTDGETEEPAGATGEHAERTDTKNRQRKNQARPSWSWAVYEVGSVVDPATTVPNNLRRRPTAAVNR